MWCPTVTCNTCHNHMTRLTSDPPAMSHDQLLVSILIWFWLSPPIILWLWCPTITLIYFYWPSLLLVVPTTMITPDHLLCHRLAPDVPTNTFTNMTSTLSDAVLMHPPPPGLALPHRPHTCIQLASLPMHPGPTVAYFWHHLWLHHSHPCMHDNIMQPLPWLWPSGKQQCPFSCLFPLFLSFWLL